MCVADTRIRAFSAYNLRSFNCICISKRLNNYAMIKTDTYTTITYTVIQNNLKYKLNGQYKGIPRTRICEF